MKKSLVWPWGSCPRQVDLAPSAETSRRAMVDFFRRSFGL